MEKELELFKGESMEEKLRMYFLNNGYFVVRSLKYKYEGNDITDIDLFLYGRFSTLSRVRTNVDIKNKKIPKAFERILWAKGLQHLLGFDSCVVATPDKKDYVKKYATSHNTILLDGNFLQKLPYELKDRLSEETFINELNTISSNKTYNYQKCGILYEQLKSRLLYELDFSGFNMNLKYLEYFMKNYSESHKGTIPLRLIYITISHSLLILDYIMKDIAYLDIEDRKKYIGNGIKYGSLGEEGINRTIDMAMKISGGQNSYQIKKMFESIEIDVIKEYFAKADTIKNIFRWAIFFEKQAFSTQLILPNNLETEFKSTIAIFLDYFKINRKSFFDIIE